MKDKHSSCKGPWTTQSLAHSITRHTPLRQWREGPESSEFCKLCGHVTLSRHLGWNLQSWCCHMWEAGNHRLAGGTQWHLEPEK